MKLCPFLVAGASMQSTDSRPGVIPITPVSSVQNPELGEILHGDVLQSFDSPFEAGKTDRGGRASSQECLGETCRFFRSGGCSFDALFDAQAVRAAAGVADGAVAADSGAASVVASLPTVLDEVWSLQRESLREVMAGFRKLETAQATLQTDVAAHIDSQVGQVQARVQQVGSQVGTVETQVTRIEAVVGDVETQVKKVETDLGGFQSAVGRVQTELETLRKQLGQVETQVKTAAETKPAVGPEILDLVGRHFETLERDVRQIESSVRSGLGDSLRTMVKESQGAALASAETSLRAVLEGVQAAVRAAAQDQQGALRGALAESQTALKSMQESQAALRTLVQESQAVLRGALQESQTVVQSTVQESQTALRSVLSEWQTQLGPVLANASGDTRKQVEEALTRLADELQASRDARLQAQAAVDGLMRETRDLVTMARRVENSQVLTHELLDEQRQVHQKVDAREKRERARQLNNAGVLSYHQGAYDTSVQRFREATELDPTLAEAFNNLGLSYTEMGREEEAIVAYQRTIELDPASGQVYNNLGYLYYRKGDLDQAVEMYQRATQRGTDTSAAYCNLGNAYYRLKRIDQAVQAWRRAIEVDPANTKAAAALERLGLETRPS